MRSWRKPRLSMTPRVKRTSQARTNVRVCRSRKRANAALRIAKQVFDALDAALAAPDRELLGQIALRSPLLDEGAVELLDVGGIEDARHRSNGFQVRA